jgi:dihydroorotate dehydrogenase
LGVCQLDLTNKDNRKEGLTVIRLSNGVEIKYVVASGASGFDGKYYFWEWLFVWFGLIKPELFVHVLKTLTLEPRRGNLHWWKPWTWLPFSPWSCVCFLKDGGVVNKVGLTNKGIKWWCEKVGPYLDYQKYQFVASIYGNEAELVEMAERLNRFKLVGLEVNHSCPNSGEAMAETEALVKSVKAVGSVSCHPIIVKVSVAQDYLAISRRLVGIAEAITLNSVPWEIVCHGKRSPLWRLEKKLGGGGGGVSGKPAQKLNWLAVKMLAQRDLLPVIGPSVMRYEDLGVIRWLGAEAVSFGAIHLKKPWEPTAIVNREKQERKERGDVEEDL